MTETRQAGCNAPHTALPRRGRIEITMATKQKSGKVGGKDTPMSVIVVPRVMCQRCYNEFSPEEVDSDEPRCPYCEQMLTL